MDYKIPVDTPISVFMGCELVTYPVPFPAGSSPKILHVPSDIGIGTLMTPQDTVYWFRGENRGGAVYRCDLINYSKEPIFQMVASLKVTRLRNVGSGTVSLSKDKIGSREQDVKVPRLDGNGDRYQFYLWNNTADFVRIELPEAINVEAVNSAVPRRIKIRTGQNLVVLNPEADIAEWPFFSTVEQRQLA